MHDAFWPIVIVLVVLGEVILLRALARTEYFSLWIGYAVLALLWPPMVWLGTAFAWIALFCGENCFS